MTDQLRMLVTYCLIHFEEARDSDRELAWRVYEKGYGITESLKKADFKRIPSIEAIRAVRREVTENKRFAPSSWAKAESRGWTRHDWEVAIGIRPPQVQFPLPL